MRYILLIPGEEIHKNDELLFEHQWGKVNSDYIGSTHQNDSVPVRRESKLASALKQALEVMIREQDFQGDMGKCPYLDSAIEAASEAIGEEEGKSAAEVIEEIKGSIRLAQKEADLAFRKMCNEDPGMIAMIKRWKEKGFASKHD